MKKDTITILTMVSFLISMITLSEIAIDGNETFYITLLWLISLFIFFISSATFGILSQNRYPEEEKKT